MKSGCYNLIKNNPQERGKFGSGGPICVADVFLIAGLATVPWSGCALVWRTTEWTPLHTEVTRWPGVDEGTPQAQAPGKLHWAQGWAEKIAFL